MVCPEYEMASPCWEMVSHGRRSESSTPMVGDDHYSREMVPPWCEVVH